jgi:hypothetical protein
MDYIPEGLGVGKSKDTSASNLGLDEGSLVEVAERKISTSESMLLT